MAGHWIPLFGTRPARKARCPEEARSRLIDAPHRIVCMRALRFILKISEGRFFLIEKLSLRA
jgi:hypothetical protein